MAANPIVTPTAFDKIALDGMPNPGIVRRTSGGNRGYKIDQAQAPGFGGGYTLFRYKELSEIEYRFSVWHDPNKPTAQSVADYHALVAFLEALNKGNDRRPPKTYVFQDLYLSHNAIKAVVAKDVGAIEKEEGKQLWSATVRFAEWKRLNLFGGAPKGPRSKEEEDLQNDLTERDTLAKTLKEQTAAIRAARLRNEGQ